MTVINFLLTVSLLFALSVTAIFAVSNLHDSNRVTVAHLVAVNQCRVDARYDMRNVDTASLDALLARCV